MLIYFDLRTTVCDIFRRFRREGFASIDSFSNSFVEYLVFVKGTSVVDVRDVSARNDDSDVELSVQRVCDRLIEFSPETSDSGLIEEVPFVAVTRLRMELEVLDTGIIGTRVPIVNAGIPL